MKAKITPGQWSVVDRSGLVTVYAADCYARICTFNHENEDSPANAEVVAKLPELYELYNAVREFMDYAGDQGLFQKEEPEFDESTEMIRKIYSLFHRIEKK